MPSETEKLFKSKLFKGAEVAEFSPNTKRHENEFLNFIKRQAGGKIDIRAIIDEDAQEKARRGDSRPMFNAMPEFYIDSFVHAGSYATLAASVLHHLNLKGKEHLLSVGSGPGYMETYFGKRVVPRGRVVGIDNADDMVNKARNVSSGQEAGNVEFRLHDANKRLPFKDNEFDHAYSVDALHWMDNWRKALDEMVRVVKPGGKVVVVANVLIRDKKLLNEGLFEAAEKKGTKLENISVIQGWDPIDRDEKVRLMFVIRKLEARKTK